MAILSKGVTLSYYLTDAFVNLAGLTNVPELGAIAEKIETTTLADGTKTYINGLKDYGDLEFTFMYVNDNPTDAWRVLSGLEASGEDTQFEVALPDETTLVFSGQVSLKLDAVGVNAPLTFTLGIAMSTEIVITNPA